MTDAPRTSAPPAPTSDRTRRLLHDLESAIEAGRVDPADVERLLGTAPRQHRRAPSAPSVLYALGAAIIFIGLALALGTQFQDLPWLARVLTPMAFPLVAFAASIGLHRRGLLWQSDAAGLGGYVAYAGACAVSITTSGWAQTPREGALLTAVAAAVGVGISGGLYLATRSDRLLWIGAPLGAAVVIPCLAYVTGMVGASTLCWAILATAIAAACVAWQLQRRPGPGATYMDIWALVIAYAAVFNAATRLDMSQLNIWHALLAVIVVIAFIAASETGLAPLLWLAAAGGVAWVLLIAIVVGSKTGLALAVLLAGVALVALGFLVARLHRLRSRRRRSSAATPA